MNINTMNDSAITKALNARIKAKGCEYGSLAEAAWWSQGFEDPAATLYEALSKHFGSMTLKQKIVFNALVQEEISIDYVNEDYAHPRITRIKNK